MPNQNNSRGLEFHCVAIGGLGELKKAENIEDDIRLTYAAITRATHEAFITTEYVGIGGAAGGVGRGWN